jgi:ADP-heptose:LPS heptosyltransferase
VGLTWQGNPTYERDHLRSVAIQRLSSLFAVEHVTFYSLQKYDGSEQLAYIEPSVRPIDLGRRLDNSGQAFVGTAQAMRELDLVISTDTSTVHLAGALGVPCWVLLPFAPDWRWGLGSESTPWYPTMRLFRQTTPKDWSGVVDRVKRALRAFEVSTKGALR